MSIDWVGTLRVKFVSLEDKLFCYFDSKIPEKHTSSYSLRCIVICYVSLALICFIDIITSDYNLVSFRPLIAVVVCFASLFCPVPFVYMSHPG